ncbi:MAG: hypothetical protein COB30_015285 [Ectothiorhodospiraceae bacterium]|nr:hypothetical protein [Ectothiorhodospiraceae bacterium]
MGHYHRLKANRASQVDVQVMVSTLALKKLNGSWYELPDGQKVNGKAKAEAALKALGS